MHLRKMAFARASTAAAAAPPPGLAHEIKEIAENNITV